MKEIQLTQGKVALVDDEDYDWLSQWKWYARKTYNKWYAVTTSLGHKKLYMHRLILNPLNICDCDHINGDGLDNTKANLRICDRGLNSHNQAARSKSGYKGVYKPKGKNRAWIADIRINSKTIHLGGFPTNKEAAKAYNNAAIQYYGKHARLNNFV